MKFSFCKKTLIPLLLLNYMSFFVFSLNTTTFTPKGTQLSNFTENFLNENGFETLRNQISITGQDEFPYNVITTFRNSKISHSDDKITELSRKVLVICIKQENFFTNKEQILDLLKHISKRKYNFSIEFLFSALDDNTLFRDFNLRGTQAYTESIEDKDIYCSLILDFDKIKNNQILTTGFSTSTPLWLMKRLTDSFIHVNQPYETPQKFLSLYRIGLLKGDETMNIFFRNSIPTCKLILKENNDLTVIKHFIDNYKIAGTEEWDSHYSFLKLSSPFKPLFLTERNFIFALETFGLIAIFLICSFSFIGKSRIRYKKEFRTAWFLIPLKLILSILSLFIAEFIIKTIPFLSNINPIFMFGVKIIFSMIFLSLLFIIQEQLRIPVTQFAYGYILTISAILNVFIFSTIDLLFFSLFFQEYFIIYIFRRAKKIAYLILAIIIMLIPFVPYTITFIKNATNFELLRFVYSRNNFNIILALILFPFQIMWFRLLVQLNIFNATKSFTPKRIILSATITIISVSITIYITLFAFICFFQKKNTNNQLPQIINTEKSYIQVLDEKKDFLEMTTHQLKITTTKKVLRYTISLTSPDSQPLYDSLYNYSASENSKSITFNIPDFPPEQITINFNCDSKTISQLKIDVLYFTEEENKYEKETKTMTITSSKVEA